MEPYAPHRREDDMKQGAKAATRPPKPTKAGVETWLFSDIFEHFWCRRAVIHPFFHKKKKKEIEIVVYIGNFVYICQTDSENHTGG